MESLVFAIALIGFAGVFAQWLAWRFQLPAIVLLLLAGLVVGPLTGAIDPDVQFAGLLQPLVAVAVAVILFEGGLTLNFHQISTTTRAVRRMILIGAPVAFGLGSLNAYYVAGLSFWSALVFGGILIVTGPTVIIPMLRQAKLAPRAASVLRWEAILADPLGALTAVFVYEAFLILSGAHHVEEVVLRVIAACVIGIGGGWVMGRAMARAFVAGYIPEYLKVPAILTVVLGSYALSNMVLEESGLLTVTVLGVSLANSRLASLGEIKRFKEIMTILLVSGVFVVLTASLQVGELVEALDWRSFVFVALLLLVVRPLSVFAGTLGTGLSVKERLLIGWIAPRGVVAVAVSGLFAELLVAEGVMDGERLTALAFAVVVVTVLAHGFSIGPLARKLGLASGGKSGVLIVGASRFSVALAERLRKMEVPVLIADRNWGGLRAARSIGLEAHYGEVLSELAEHSLPLEPYAYLLAATDNDAYNALVCTNFGPEIGRGNVLQIGRGDGESERNQLAVTLGGRAFLTEIGGYYALDAHLADGWKFRETKLTDDYDGKTMLAERHEKAVTVFVLTEGGRLLLPHAAELETLKTGDRVLSFGPSPDANGKMTEG